jgi:hypothetical protein
MTQSPIWAQADRLLRCSQTTALRDKAAVRCRAAPSQPINDRCADLVAVRCNREKPDALVVSTSTRAETGLSPQTRDFEPSVPNQTFADGNCHLIFLDHRFRFEPTSAELLRKTVVFFVQRKKRQLSKNGRSSNLNRNLCVCWAVQLASGIRSGPINRTGAAARNGHIGFFAFN